MQASVPQSVGWPSLGDDDRTQATPPETRLRFTLERWCLWYPGAAPQGRSWPNGKVLSTAEGTPDLEFLPMMRRRRLSPLARAAIAVAWECRGSLRGLPAVFFSRHGESQDYFDMLLDLARQQEISPSRFSLSVHNAIAGLYSLCSDTRAPCVALAGGADDFYGAFLEAAGMLMEKSCERILVVWYEQPLPDRYQNDVAGPDRTLALGMRLSPDSESRPLIELRRLPGRMEASASSRLQAFCEAILRGERSSAETGDRRLWGWKLRDA